MIIHISTILFHRGYKYDIGLKNIFNLMIMDLFIVPQDIRSPT